MWQHWLKAGDRYARERFEEYYPIWKAAMRDKPNAPSRHRLLKERMLRGGVAAVPHVIREIEKGDETLVSVASKLTGPRNRRIKNTGPRVPEKATRAKALEWWRENKQKWTVFRPVENE